MWDLNDSPEAHRRRAADDESEEGCSCQKTSVDGGDDDHKGKRVGSVSNSSSSAVVIEDYGSEAEQDHGHEYGRITKKHNSSSSTSGTNVNSKIFGFPVPNYDADEEAGSGIPPVTHQFFPVDEAETAASSAGDGDGGGGGELPRAHWVGVKFCQSTSPSPHHQQHHRHHEHNINASQKSVHEVSQAPFKKSRRGPRSRSSQYRGVTYYRRTGRWESHIWSTFTCLIRKIYSCYMQISIM